MAKARKPRAAGPTAAAEAMMHPAFVARRAQIENPTPPTDIFADLFNPPAFAMKMIASWALKNPYSFVLMSVAMPVLTGIADRPKVVPITAHPSFKSRSPRP